MKGPVISQDIYGDIGLRVFSDLDILVEPKDALNSFSILTTNGFQPELGLNEKQAAKFILNEDNLSFYDQSEEIAIEIHWEMSGRYLSRPLYLSHIKEGITTTRIDRKEVPTLSDEDQLIYLCIHGTKHGWENIEQVRCISELIGNKKIDWDAVDAAVSAHRCRRMVYLGLYLAWKFLDAPVPKSIRNKIEKDDKIRILTAEVTMHMFRNSSGIGRKNLSDRFSPFHIHIRDNLPDRLRYGLRLIFSPTNKEWLFFPVPAWLSFLHHLFRPFRLLAFSLRKKNA
jgi:hypothetical protein